MRIVLVIEDGAIQAVVSDCEDLLLIVIDQDYEHPIYKEFIPDLAKSKTLNAFIADELKE